MGGYDMDFYEKVLFLTKRKGVSINKMLTDLGLGKSSMADWKERRNIPSGEVVVKIAKYFSVTTDYLLGVEGIDAIDETEKPTTLDEKRSAILEIAGRLSEDDFEKLKSYADYLRQQQK